MRDGEAGTWSSKRGIPCLASRGQKVTGQMFGIHRECWEKP